MASMLRRANTSGLVYHYTSATTAFEFILQDMSLRLSPFGDTNDPGEEGLPSPITGDRAAPLLFSELEEMMARRRMACFARDRPNTIYHDYLPLTGHGYARDRMWAQYADNHRGVCLFFDRLALESTFREQMANHGIALADDVKYHPQSAFACAGYDRTEYEKLGHKAWLQQACIRTANARSFVKREDWESEQEYRLVFIPSVPQQAQVQSAFWIQGALVAICVGHRFPNGLLPCVRDICGRRSLNAFRMQYIGDPKFDLLYPTQQPFPSPLISTSAPQ